MRQVIWTTAFLLLATVTGPASVQATEEEPYETRCAQCHGLDGRADTPAGRAMKIPSFAGSAWAKATPEAICEAVRASAPHKSLLGKLDAEALLATCRTVKDLSSGG